MPFQMSMIHLIGVLLVLGADILPNVNSAKILILPLLGSSHTRSLGKLGAALIEKGHNVQSVLNGDCESIEHFKHEKLKLIPYNNTLGGCIMESPQVKFTINMAAHSSDLGWFKIIDAYINIAPLLKTEMRSLLSDEKLFKMLKKINFDLIIIDGIPFNRYAYVLAYRLQKPIVTIQSDLNPLDVGLPALPSLHPSKQGYSQKDLGFMDRMSNMINIYFDHYILPWLTSVSSNSLVKDYAPEMPYISISSIVSKTKLWFLLKDDVIDFPTIAAPNIIQIGGMNTAPAQPLTGEFKVIADAAKNGIIVVNFGSDISLPTRMQKRILLALSQVPQTVIMQYTGEPIKGLSGNVYLVPKIPQNDLVGHASTVLFLTHCGTDSQYEALYHGVPILSFPVFADQIHNAMRISHHGMGKAIDTKEITYDDVLSAIKEIISDTRTKEICRLKSDILKKRPVSPSEKAIYWIDYVLRYGGEDLRPTGSDLGFLQFWCLDLLLFISVLVLISIYIFIKLGKFVWSCLCSRKKHVPSKPQMRPKSD